MTPKHFFDKWRQFLLGATTVLFLLVGLFNPAGTYAQPICDFCSWLKGDLHAHSTHSDGDSPVDAVIASAEQAGLEFFALTDHDNNMNGDPTHWYDPDYKSDQLILLYGIEWTTSQGHANIWATGPIDYEEIWQTNRDEDPAAAIQLVHDQGALFSINHPAAYFCCPWEYPVSENVDSIEVWNSMYRIPNLNRWAGHRIWDELLKVGRRIPAVGGSDTHQLVGFQSKLFGHGNPTTWVFTEDDTAEAILEGIRAGHISISYATDFARLDFAADADGDSDYETMVGDVVPQSGQVINFRIKLVGNHQSIIGSCSGALELPRQIIKRVRNGQISSVEMLRRLNDSQGGDSDDLETAFLLGVFKNGRLFRMWFLSGDDTCVKFSDIPDSITNYRVELMGDAEFNSPVQKLLYGRLLAMTNPIYVAYPEP